MNGIKIGIGVWMLFVWFSYSQPRSGKSIDGVWNIVGILWTLIGMLFIFTGLFP